MKAMVVSWFFLFISVLIIVPFITLFERKVLSYIQNRKGPKKVGFLGVIQPVLDGVKLLIKETAVPQMGKLIIYAASSLFAFTLMIFSWTLMPSLYPFYILIFSLVYFIILSSFNVYRLLGAGWSRKRSYRLLGAVRGSCQVISYEVKFLFIVLVPCFINWGFRVYNFSFSFRGVFFLSVTIVIWLIIILLETNRSPFDFSEGERELVSGFKTEYSSFFFALLFLGEYGMILFLRLLTSIIYFNCFFVYLLSLFFCFFFIWVRGRYPRYRYDLLMRFCWKFLLPFLVSYVFFLLFFL